MKRGKTPISKLGVPIPAILRKMLEIMRDKGGTQENKDQENKYGLIPEKRT